MLNFWGFVEERENVRKRRTSGEAAPWTTDPVLQRGRFCNVRRRDDRVTNQLYQWYRARAADQPKFTWFLAAIGRQTNRLEPLVGMPLPWRRASAVSHWRKYGGPLINARAFFPSLCRLKGSDHGDVPARMGVLLNSVWEKRYKIDQAVRGGSLQKITEALAAPKYWGPFIGYQIALDLYEMNWVMGLDAETWTLLGPGSLRGLERLNMEPTIDSLIYLTRVAQDEEGLDLLLHDVEHSVCEYDKYVRGWNDPTKLSRFKAAS